MARRHSRKETKECRAKELAPLGQTLEDAPTKEMCKQISNQDVGFDNPAAILKVEGRQVQFVLCPFNRTLYFVLDFFLIAHGNLPLAKMCRLLLKHRSPLMISHNIFRRAFNLPNAVDVDYTYHSICAIPIKAILGLYMKIGEC